MVKFDGVVGLSSSEVDEARARHGDNALPAPEAESFKDKLLENFEDPMIKILIAALVVTMALAFMGFSDWLEPIGIAVAVMLATLVATWSEFKNEESFQELQLEASKVKNNVFRDGSTPKSIFASDIVVGDLVLLTAGDKIPADGVLIAGDLQVDQSSLNGEADPVRKTPPPAADASASPRSSPRGSRRAKKAPDAAQYEGADEKDFLDEHLVFRGGVVDEGEAVLRVRATGLNTIYGQMFDELNSNEDERESPLQAKLQVLADGISMVGYIGATFIAISFLFKQFVMDNGYDSAKIAAYLSAENWAVAVNDVVTSVILAVIIVVVAVPEGLPMMIAIVLSLNMRKLLGSNVLVRRLLGIETAGSLNLLFVDKTGTLTRGTFVPQAFTGIDGKSHKTYEAIPKPLRDVLGFTVRESTSAMISESDKKPIGGNASDRALLSFLSKSEATAKVDSLKHNHELLFNSSRKFSAIELALDKKGTGVPAPLQGDVVTLVKGAPEVILEHCTLAFNASGNVVDLAKSDVTRITAAMDAAAHEGVRTIGVAASKEALKEHGAGAAEHPAAHGGEPPASMPDDLILIGVIGIYDEIREETAPSLVEASSAGIQVVMITGDRRETAEAVARQIGLLPPTVGRKTRSGRDTGSDKRVVTSQELQKMSDDQVVQQLPGIAVISRALPTDKSRLVKLAKRRGNVVGMTGDGVNDSAALKKADVGFAMGSGSEVAKEAADIVILDDNFASITKAVLYGRTIFKSIRKFIVFQSTVNVASMLIVFLGPFLGFDFPLTLIQLLWVNLVMDTLAALAFGGEAALSRYMSEKPIRREANIISPLMWSAILFEGVAIGVLCICALLSTTIRSWFVRNGAPSEEVFLTAFFAFFIFLTNFNAFNVRTTRVQLLDNILQNTGFLLVILVIFTVQVAFTYIGGSILRTVGLTMDEWIWVIVGSAVIIPLDLVRKLALGAFSSKSKSKKD